MANAGADEYNVGDIVTFRWGDGEGGELFFNVKIVDIQTGRWRGIRRLGVKLLDNQPRSTPLPVPRGRIDRYGRFEIPENRVVRQARVPWDIAHHADQARAEAAAAQEEENENEVPPPHELDLQRKSEEKAQEELARCKEEIERMKKVVQGEKYGHARDAVGVLAEAQRQRERAVPREALLRRELEGDRGMWNWGVRGVASRSAKKRKKTNRRRKTNRRKKVTKKKIINRRRKTNRRRKKN